MEAMPAGLSGGVMITSRFVAKLVRSVTPGALWRVSIAVPLADANTSAVPSLWICDARSVDEPKSNVTVTFGCAVWKSWPIWVNALVKDEAANTMSGVDVVADEVDEELEQETPSTAMRDRTRWGPAWISTSAETVSFVTLVITPGNAFRRLVCAGGDSVERRSARSRATS